MAETPLAPFFCPSGFSRHPSAARDRIKTLLHYIMLPSQKQIPSKEAWEKEHERRNMET